MIPEVGQRHPSMTWFRIWHIIGAVRFERVVCTQGQLASLRNELQGANPRMIAVLKRELSDLLTDEQRRFLFGNGAE